MNCLGLLVLHRSTVHQSKQLTQSAKQHIENAKALIRNARLGISYAEQLKKRFFGWQFGPRP
jgi:hypothetical protein